MLLSVESDWSPFGRRQELNILHLQPPPCGMVCLFVTTLIPWTATSHTRLLCVVKLHSLSARAIKGCSKRQQRTPETKQEIKLTVNHIPASCAHASGGGQIGDSRIFTPASLDSRYSTPAAKPSLLRAASQASMTETNVSDILTSGEADSTVTRRRHSGWGVTCRGVRSIGRSERWGECSLSYIGIQGRAWLR